MLLTELKKVIRLIIGDQNALILGKQLMDTTLTANAFSLHCEKSGRSILCKINLGKTYDNANWFFLLKMLKLMGFGCKWIEYVVYYQIINTH